MVAKQISDEYEIINIFKKIHRLESVLWLWQNVGIKKRIVHFGIVKFFDLEKRHLSLRPKNKVSGRRFEFNTDDEIYFFSKDDELAGKTKIVSNFETGIVVNLPSTLNRIKCDEFNIFEVDDDDKYKDKRAAPRGKAKERRVVTIITDESKNGKKSDLYVLYDLSKGGLSFIIDDPAMFRIGEKIVLTAIDGASIQKPLDGEVVAIRTIKGMDLQIKACVKFSS